MTERPLTKKTVDVLGQKRMAYRTSAAKAC